MECGTVLIKFFGLGLLQLLTSIGLFKQSLSPTIHQLMLIMDSVAVTDAAQGAVEELNVSAVSGALTIAGSPGDDELCYFRFGRDVSAGDMAGDAQLHGIKIFFTTDS